jgi:TRAP-type C4-dicarboxylate transport system permease large subunit
VAITAVSAVLAVIIPPSILMIVWGGVLTVSIGVFFRRHRAWCSDRAGPDGNRPRICHDPLARSAGLDPVHFAMIGIVSLAFGLVTPPYGLCLMIACSIAGIRMKDARRDTMIILVPMLAVFALLIRWPQVALFVPSLISPEFLR